MKKVFITSCLFILFSLTDSKTQAQCKKNEVQLCLDQPWGVSTKCVNRNKVSQYLANGWYYCGVSILPGSREKRYESLRKLAKGKIEADRLAASL